MIRIPFLSLACAFLAVVGCGGATTGGGAGADAPVTPDSTSSCPASLAGEACHAGESCGEGLACDYVNNAISMTCLERAGTCCERSAECMSGDCQAGTCAASPLDFPCETIDDCVLGSGAPYGHSGVFCFNAGLHGVCCPKDAPGGPPGCPNA